jgi:hypothetical protein
VDCIEEQSPCTAACEPATQRTYSLLTPAVKKGKACINATDCLPGDGACPTPSAITTSTAIPTSTQEGSGGDQNSTSTTTNTTNSTNGSTTNNSADQPSTSTSTKEKKGGGVAAAVIIVLLFLGISAVLIYRRHRRRRNHPPKTPRTIKAQRVEIFGPTDGADLAMHNRIVGDDGAIAFFENLQFHTALNAVLSAVPSPPPTSTAAEQFRHAIEMAVSSCSSDAGERKTIIDCIKLALDFGTKLDSNGGLVDANRPHTDEIEEDYAEITTTFAPTNASVLYMYTLETKLYNSFNLALREFDPDDPASVERFRPFAPYTRLMLAALQKLPILQGRVFRGLRVVRCCSMSFWIVFWCSISWHGIGSNICLALKPACV